MAGMTMQSAPSTPAADAHPSRAALFGHPLHPVVVPLPIGMLVAALVSDLANVVSGDRFFVRASRLLVAGGVASGIVAAAIGALDFARIRPARGPVGIGHAAGNATVLALSTLSLVLRLRSPEERPPVAAALSAAASALLVVTGWLGGELVFRHRIGVIASSGAEGEDQAPRPSQAEGERD
jgi:uncharacterized membrane protein